MTAWDWIFGIAGIVGTIFGVYSHYKNEMSKAIESAKNQVFQEKIRNINSQLISAFHTADSIVQVSKLPETTPQQLKEMARILRGSLYILAKDTEKEEDHLRSWRFGKMLKSETETTAGGAQMTKDAYSKE